MLLIREAFEAPFVTQLAFSSWQSSFLSLLSAGMTSASHHTSCLQSLFRPILLVFADSMPCGFHFCAVLGGVLCFPECLPFLFTFALRGLEYRTLACKAHALRPNYTPGLSGILWTFGNSTWPMGHLREMSLGQRLPLAELSLFTCSSLVLYQVFPCCYDKMHDRNDGMKDGPTVALVVAQAVRGGAVTVRKWMNAGS